MRRDFAAEPRLRGVRARATTILEPPIPLVHVTRYGVTGAWTRHGIKHHLAPFGRDQKMQVGDLQSIGPGAHRGRHRPRARRAVRRDRVRRGDATRRTVASALERGRRGDDELALRRPDTSRRRLRRPGRRATWPRPWVGCWSPSSASGTSTRSSRSSSRTAGWSWGDIRVGRHLFEVDGKVKYTPVEDGGVATEAADGGGLGGEEARATDPSRGTRRLAHHLRGLLAAAARRCPDPAAGGVRRHGGAVR